MDKYDYEIDNYVVHYGTSCLLKEYCKTEEEAVKFAKSVKDQTPYIYQIRRMIIDLDSK